ncbi:MAG TPA: alkaline phosphatase family protein [Steroidobacteraceae bacterium]|nr:alkaline phosphatase family protein [Steroidobacteraceae bacterium]
MTHNNIGQIARIVSLAMTATVATGFALPSLASEPATATPIKHVIVIFQENVSFDHYFGTYPVAANSTAGEPVFKAASDTPAINGLLTGPAAPPNNPTLNVAGTGTIQPFRLGRNQATTCDEDHNYTDEQAAYHAGQMDLVVQKLSSAAANCAPDKSTVMGYYDGNTVTALWNYAQHFAISDNSFSTTYGPSTPGAINLVAGNTHGVTGATQTGFGPVPGINQSTGASGSQTVTVAGSDSNGNTGAGSIVGDPRPFGDVCNPLGSTQVKLDSPGKNVGDLLNAKGVSWGWFQGGFGNCNSIHKASDGTVKQDYIGHHEPFQYFASTQNLTHLAPSSPAMVGFTDQAKHQYDLSALFTINSVSGATSRTYDITGFQPGVKLPAVTFLKAPGFMDGHAAYSDPLLEQHFIVQVVNTVMTSKYWNDTAIVVLYDDSDGWYDHVYPPLVNASALSALPSSSDALTGPGQCGVPVAGAVLGRCGYGPRQPFLVISPFARRNYVDHTATDQTSVLRFIEDNFTLGRIDAASGKSVAQGGSFDQVAGSLDSLFSFDEDEDGGHGDRDSRRLLLDANTGEPARW